VAFPTFLIALRRGKGRGSFYLQGLLFCASLILLFSFCELSSRDVSRIFIFSHMAYVSIAFSPVFWFLFAYQYGIGRYSGSRRIFAGLSIIPTLTSIFAVWDERFHLLWRSHSVESVGKLRMNVIHAYGPWFWVHFSYSYILFIVGAVIILKEFIDHLELYRQQAILVVTATGLPLLFNLVYVFRVVPGLKKDFSPIAIAASGVLFTVSILKYHLFELTPPPRALLGDYLDDGVLVVDESGRIVDCNAAGASMLGRAAASDLIGLPLHEILPSCPADIVERVETSGRLDSIVPAREGASMELTIKRIELDPANDPRFCVIMHSRRIPALPTVGIYENLSTRELEIARLLAVDATIKEIAERLFISENTVKTHVRHIYKKTGANTRQELADRLDRE
jgi:DNA-binding CsgD family transcriptional regulator/PAS domain-containing protein